MTAARSHPTTYLVLFRGINVGGKNKVPMAELKALLTQGLKIFEGHQQHAQMLVDMIK